MGTAQRVKRRGPTPKAQRASLMALPQPRGLGWLGQRQSQIYRRGSHRWPRGTNGDSESLSRAYQGLCLSVCELSSQWPQQL